MDQTPRFDLAVLPLVLVVGCFTLHCGDTPNFAHAQLAEDTEGPDTAVAARYRNADAAWDTESDTFPWGHDDTDWDWNWDTGQTPHPICHGEWLTHQDCLAAMGSFDLDYTFQWCVDGDAHRCCLADTLSNPCPSIADFACAAPSDCQNRGGAVVAGWECSDAAHSCCQGAAPPDTDTGDFWDPGFDPASCPLAAYPTAEDQPNPLASGVCLGLPMFDDPLTAPWYCPQDIYDRIEREIEQIKALFPVAAADLGGQIYNAFDQLNEPFVMLCVPGGNDFPAGGFEKIANCYGGVYNKCLFESHGPNCGTHCGQAHIHFNVAANTARMLDAFQQEANNLSSGSICELNSYFGVNPTALNGFHITDVSDEHGIWVWKVRSTSTFSLNIAHCDVTLHLWSQPDPIDPSSSIVSLMGDNPPSIDNDSTTFCNDPLFLTGGQ